MNIPLVSSEGIPESLRVTWDAASPGERTFIQALSHAPVHAARFVPFYNGTRFETKLGIKLSELVRLAVVNASGCSN